MRSSDKKRLRIRKRIRGLKSPPSKALRVAKPARDRYELPGHPKECDCPLCEHELLVRAAAQRRDSGVRDEPSAG